MLPLMDIRFLSRRAARLTATALYLPERFEARVRERYEALRIGDYIRSNAHDRLGVHERLVSGSVANNGVCRWH
jgi:hypothetical protein